jgi:PAS domain S-box-containing protein
VIRSRGGDDAASVGDAMYLDENIDRDACGALLDAVATPAFFVDRDHRYLAFNEADRSVVKMLYGVDLKTGDSIFDTVTNDADRDDLLANLDRSLAGETHCESGWYGDHPDNRRFYAITYAPYLQGGEILGVAAVAMDETHLRNTEEALALSEQKFAAAFRASPDAINLNRMSDGMYLEVNEGFTRLTGFTAEDVAGKTSVELSIWDDPDERDRLVRGLREEGRVDSLEARFRRKDGSVAAAEMSASIIDIGGEPAILSVTRDVSERKRVQEELRTSYERLERTSHEIVQALGRVGEARDPYTQGHEQRAAELCRVIATQMHVAEDDIAMLETAALVHDIGKLNVPAEILTKPGKLSSVEFALIKEHPQHSYEILSGISFEGPIGDIVLQHHERMDGSGYPLGLSGDEIAPLARILAVADVVEAMATHRPYRPSLGLEAAVEELCAHPEKYDQEVVSAFLFAYHEECFKL